MEHERYYNEIYNSDQPQHEAKWSHEMLGGAAAFAAMREYEKHQEANGKPPSHQMAKELLAGIVGAEVDRLAETKGLDEMDRMRAKDHAQQEASCMYDNNYGGQQY
ncbi:g8324 [Coccomyxa elongata]